MNQSESSGGFDAVDSTAETADTPYAVLGVDPRTPRREVIETFAKVIGHCPVSSAQSGADPYTTIVAAGEALGIPYDHGYVGVRVVEKTRRIPFPR